MTVTRVAAWAGRVTAETVMLPFPEALPMDLLVVFGGRVGVTSWNSDSLVASGFVGSGVYTDYLPGLGIYRVEEPTSTLSLQAPVDALAVAMLYRGMTATDGVDAAGHYGSSGMSYPPAGRTPGRTIFSRAGAALVIRSVAFYRLPAEMGIQWPGGDAMNAVGFVRAEWDDEGWSQVSSASVDVRDAMTFGDAEEQFWGVAPYNETYPGAYNAGDYVSWCIVLASNALVVLPSDPANPAPVGSGQFPI